MATWDDVRQIALALPEATERVSRELANRSDMRASSMPSMIVKSL